MNYGNQSRLAEQAALELFASMAPLPSPLARMAYLWSLRGTEGKLEHRGLARSYGAGVASQVLTDAFHGCLRQLASMSIDELEAHFQALRDSVWHVLHDYLILVDEVAHELRGELFHRLQVRFTYLLASTTGLDSRFISTHTSFVH